MKKRLALCALLLALSLSARAQEGPSRANGNAAAATAGVPVRPGIWKLHGYDPGLPSDDLAPLKSLLGRASVIGLGEVIHTTGGAYQMKHRVIRYLVSQMGYRLLAFESPAVGAERLEAYVQSCSGTPEAAIQTLFAVWQSTEVRDLAQWLCDWNGGHSRPQDKVHVIGFDTQNAYGQTPSDAAGLRAYLPRVGVAAADPRSADLDLCEGVSSSEGTAVSAERYAACSGALSALDRLFTKDAARLTRLTSKRDLDWARLHLSNLRSWEDTMYFYADFALSSTARDRGMAYQLLQLRQLRFPNAKTILWAHNSHLGKANTSGRWPSLLYMGQFLAQALKTKYQVIATSSNDTQIDWPEQGCGPTTEIGGPGSIEEILLGLGAGDVLVDLKQRGLIPGVIPAGRLWLGYYQILVDRTYDLLISLEHSPKMNPLSWPSCR